MKYGSLSFLYFPVIRREFYFFQFVFCKGSSCAKTCGCVFLFLFYVKMYFFTRLVSHVPHGPHGTLEAPFRYEQSFRLVENLIYSTQLTTLTTRKINVLPKVYSHLLRLDQNIGVRIFVMKKIHFYD